MTLYSYRLIIKNINSYKFVLQNLVRFFNDIDIRLASNILTQYVNIYNICGTINQYFDAELSYIVQYSL